MKILEGEGGGGGRGSGEEKGEFSLSSLSPLSFIIVSSPFPPDALVTQAS